VQANTVFAKTSCEYIQNILEVASVDSYLVLQGKRTWKTQIRGVPLPATSHEEGLQVAAARRGPRVREVLQGPVPAWGRLPGAPASPN